MRAAANPFTRVTFAHGHRGLPTRLSWTTTRIASARLEALAGWRVNVTHYELEARTRTSLVTLGPEQVQAETPGAAWTTSTRCASGCS